MPKKIQVGGDSNKQLQDNWDKVFGKKEEPKREPIKVEVDEEFEVNEDRWR